MTWHVISLRSKDAQKQLARTSLTRQVNPRSLGSWWVKGTEESTSRVNSSVTLTHHDPRDLGLTCLVKERKIQFRFLYDLGFS